MFKPCVVIPVYNHEQAAPAVIEDVLSQGYGCVVVDDGSGPACASLLDELAVMYPDHIKLLRHEVNRGKGSAVLTGFRHAYEAGYTHVVQIDADGQHRTADIPRFLDRAAASPEALIVGYPMFDESVPPMRFYARYLTHVWVWINTLSFAIKDSMCGFRVYPLAAVITLDRSIRLGKRMDFDTEVTVRLHWAGVKVINVPTVVVYPRDGISHFRVWSDNVRISLMHANLFFGMLLRLPALISRRWSEC